MFLVLIYKIQCCKPIKITHNNRQWKNSHKFIPNKWGSIQTYFKWIFLGKCLFLYFLWFSQELFSEIIVTNNMIIWRKKYYTLNSPFCPFFSLPSTMYSNWHKGYHEENDEGGKKSSILMLANRWEKSLSIVWCCMCLYRTQLLLLLL